MIKTILVLEDGTEIMAGSDRINAIQSVSVEEICNDGDDIAFGSVCSAKISIDIITPKNQLLINAGKKTTVYEEQNGMRRKKGIFTTEKPQKKNANTTRIEAYDNISLLDKDVTKWFNSLDGFPYTAYNMAKMACEQCGLNLANESILNGDFLINENKLSSVTARQIIRWIGEICGCFCVANADGDVLYRWYEPNNTQITSIYKDNSVMFLQGSLIYADYQTKTIDRVQIQKSADDAGISYPKDLDGGNAYVIQSNPFLMASNDSESVNSVAQNIYEIAKNISYTPCKVSIPSSFIFGVGDVIRVIDANGVEISAYVMQKRRNGHKETLESMGNYERNGATSIYSTSFGDNYGRMLKIEKDLGELSITATDAQKSVARVEIKADDNTASIGQLARVQTEQGEAVASISSKADSNAARIEQVASAQTAFGESIASVESKADANSAEISRIASVQTKQGESIASVESKADANSASIVQLSSTQTEQGESIAAIEAKTDKNSSEIRIEVQRVSSVANGAAQEAGTARDEAGAAQSTADAAQSAASSAQSAASNAQSTANEAKSNSSNGAYIIARINEDGSVVKIGANKLELSGYATFASLESEGATAIHGANILTGTVDADVLKTGGIGQTGTVLGDNLMFNAGAVKYSDAEARYMFFVDPALYNVFIGVEGGSDAKILRIHSEGNGLFDSYNGERLYLGSIEPGNDFVTRAEVQGMIEDALSGTITLSAPETYMDGTDGYAFTITNLNGYGDIVYWTIWEDTSSGKTWASDTMRSSDSVVHGYIKEFPPSSGIVGVEAYVEYNGYYSNTSRDTQEYA